MATEIVWAAGDGDLERIKSLVQHTGVDVNVKAGRGWSAILMAVHYGHFEVTKYLVEECQVDVNDTTAEGNGPLHLCCQQSRPEIFMYLAEECKADIHVHNNLGNNPLHLAALYGHLEVVKHLIEKRQMDPEIRNINGATALHCAFAGGQIEILRYLIVHAASIDNSKSFQAVNYSITQKFINAAQRQNPNISLQNVVFIPVKEFLKNGSIPSYEQCEKLGIHVSAGSCLEDSNVLFISHRWQANHEPDPDRKSFSIIEAFIGKSEQIDFVWLDFSCVVQDRKDPNYSLQTENIPTAIFASTHFLSVPSYEERGCTHLFDYLNRGWVQMECMVAMFSGCQMSVAFDAFDTLAQEEKASLNFVDIVPYRSCKKSGFKFACEEALHKCDLASPLKVDEAWGKGGTLLKEPVELLKKYVDAVIVCKNSHPDIFYRMLTQKFSVEDINFLGDKEDALIGDKIFESYKLGEFSVPSDRIDVAKLSVFSISYSMYDMGDQSLTVVGDGNTFSTENDVVSAGETTAEHNWNKNALKNPNEKDNEVRERQVSLGSQHGVETFVGGSYRSELPPEQAPKKVRTGCRCLIM